MLRYGKAAIVPFPRACGLGQDHERGSCRCRVVSTIEPGWGLVDLCYQENRRYQMGVDPDEIVLVKMGVWWICLVVVTVIGHVWVVRCSTHYQCSGWCLMVRDSAKFRR